MTRQGEPKKINEIVKPFKDGLLKPKVKTKMFSKRLMWDAFQKHSKSIEILEKHNINEYVIDDKTDKVIRTFMRYFRGDENFNEDGLITSEPSLRKGFLLWGDHGVGKSLLFDILHAAGQELYLEKGFRKMRFKYILSAKFVDDYMSSIKNHLSNFDIKHYHHRDLYIDDLSFEKMAFFKFELFGELLYVRDRNKAITHASSNNSPSELAERYGSHIGDRLPKMFNIIKWTGESLRE